jgi:hypothetical protein
MQAMVANLHRFSRTENLDKLDEHFVDNVALWVEGSSSNYKGRRKFTEACDAEGTKGRNSSDGVDKAFTPSQTNPLSDRLKCAICTARGAKGHKAKHHWTACTSKGGPLRHLSQEDKKQIFKHQSDQRTEYSVERKKPRTSAYKQSAAIAQELQELRALRTEYEAFASARKATGRAIDDQAPSFTMAPNLDADQSDSGDESARMTAYLFVIRLRY